MKAQLTALIVIGILLIFEGALILSTLYSIDEKLSEIRYYFKDEVVENLREILSNQRWNP